ncbi:MAG: hypothetical protein K0S16_2256, partial [Moraxellaceae bacterium]|nr:hypothetical protein [Moraxellaceae bacterium]
MNLVAELCKGGNAVEFVSAPDAADGIVRM